MMKIKDIKWVLGLCFCLCLYTYGHAQQVGLSIIKEDKSKRQILIKGEKEIEFAYEKNKQVIKVVGYFEHKTTSFIRVVPINSFNYQIFNQRQSEVPHIIPMTSLIHLKTQKTVGNKLVTGLSYGVAVLGVTGLGIGLFNKFENNIGNKEFIQTGVIMSAVSIPIIISLRKKTYKIKDGPWSLIQ